MKRKYIEMLDDEAELPIPEVPVGIEDLFSEFNKNLTQYNNLTTLQNRIAIEGMSVKAALQGQDLGVDFSNMGYGIEMFSNQPSLVGKQVALESINNALTAIINFLWKHLDKVIMATLAVVATLFAKSKLAKDDQGERNKEVIATLRKTIGDTFMKTQVLSDLRGYTLRQLDAEILANSSEYSPKNVEFTMHFLFDKINDILLDFENVLVSLNDIYSLSGSSANDKHSVDEVSKKIDTIYSHSKVATDIVYSKTLINDFSRLKSQTLPVSDHARTRMASIADRPKPGTFLKARDRKVESAIHIFTEDLLETRERPIESVDLSLESVNLESLKGMLSQCQAKVKAITKVKDTLVSRVSSVKDVPVESKDIPCWKNKAFDEEVDAHTIFSGGLIKGDILPMFIHAIAIITISMQDVVTVANAVNANVKRVGKSLRDIEQSEEKKSK